MADAQLDAAGTGPPPGAAAGHPRRAFAAFCPNRRSLMTRIQIARHPMAPRAGRARLPGKTVVLLAGGGHVLRDRGVPVHLAPDVSARVLLLQAGSAPQGTPAVDLVLPAPALAPTDYCASLRAPRPDSAPKPGSVGAGIRSAPAAPGVATPVFPAGRLDHSIPSAGTQRQSRVATLTCRFQLGTAGAGRSVNAVGAVAEDGERLAVLPVDAKTAVRSCTPEHQPGIRMSAMAVMCRVGTCTLRREWPGGSVYTKQGPNTTAARMRGSPRSVPRRRAGPGHRQPAAWWLCRRNACRGDARAVDARPSRSASRRSSAKRRSPPGPWLGWRAASCGATSGSGGYRSRGCGRCLRIYRLPATPRPATPGAAEDGYSLHARATDAVRTSPTPPARPTAPAGRAAGTARARDGSVHSGNGCHSARHPAWAGRRPRRGVPAGHYALAGADAGALAWAQATSRALPVGRQAKNGVGSMAWVGFCGRRGLASREPGP